MSGDEERRRTPDEIIPTRPPPHPPARFPVPTPIEIPPDHQQPEEAPAPPPTKRKPPRNAPSQRGIRKPTPPEHTAIVIKDRARAPSDPDLMSCALLCWR